VDSRADTVGGVRIPSQNEEIMTIKKSLLALGTAGAVAIAGAGVANAADAPADTPADDGTASSSSPTAGSAELSANRDVFGSITGADALGSFTGDQIDYEKTIAALASIAGGAASVAAIAGAYNAVVGASDTWQEVVSNTTAWLQANGYL
jgi:hypothetical protein